MNVRRLFNNLKFLGIGCFLVISIPATQAGDNLQNHLEPLRKCLKQSGHFLFLEQQNVSIEELAKYIPACYISNVDEQRNFETLHYLKKEFLQSSVRKNLKKFNTQQLQTCYQQWEADWDKAFDNALKGKEWHIVGRIHIPQASVDNTDKALSIFMRARLEREMTLILEKRKEPLQHSGDGCYNPWINIAFARAENVAFSITHDYFLHAEEYGISSDTFPGIWLITQHADLFPEFRKQGLQFFESYQKKHHIDPEYVRALKRRIDIMAHHMETYFRP